jgi:hypothetical protein
MSYDTVNALKKNGFPRVIYCVLAAFASLVSGQAPSGAPQKQVTDVVAYGTVVRMLAQVDAKAQQLDDKGQSNGLRGAISAKLGLASPDASMLLSHCRNAESKIKDLDTQANTIISATKAKYANSKQAGRVPPVPPQLLALQKQKEGVVRDTMAAFDRDLSADGRGKIASYVQSLFGATAQIVSTK